MLMAFSLAIVTTITWSTSGMGWNNVSKCITNNILTRHITLNQTQYILKVLKKFGMADCKPIATPLPKKTVLHRAMV